MTTFGIVGSGGFAREVLPVAARMLVASPDVGDHELVFVDRRPGPAVNGRRVLSFDEFLQLEGDKRYCVGIGDGAIRRRVDREFSDAGIEPFSIVSPDASILDANICGGGLVLCPFAMITSNVQLGRHVQINLYAYVAHDCVVGDFVTFAPGAKCNGRVVIEDDVYVGAGAIIRNGEPGRPLTIGRGAVVGMGAVVTRSVPPGVTVVGNPARPIRSG